MLHACPHEMRALPPPVRLLTGLVRSGLVRWGIDTPEPESIAIEAHFESPHKVHTNSEYLVIKLTP
jgi:hypothetical protein